MRRLHRDTPWVVNFQSHILAVPGLGSDPRKMSSLAGCRTGEINRRAMGSLDSAYEEHITCFLVPKAGQRRWVENCMGSWMVSHDYTAIHCKPCKLFSPAWELSCETWRWLIPGLWHLSTMGQPLLVLQGQHRRSSPDLLWPEQHNLCPTQAPPALQGSSIPGKDSRGLGERYAIRYKVESEQVEAAVAGTQVVHQGQSDLWPYLNSHRLYLGLCWVPLPDPVAITLLLVGLECQC